jgi:bifunctional non-homologous end joining protein LigD
VRFSGELGVDPGELVAAACRIGLEGVIGKRRDSRYVTRRSPDWIKLKCGLRQEFVIGGFTDPQGSRAGIGALLLGYYDGDGVLRFAGHVGSGFDGASLRHLRAVLAPIETESSPFPPRAVPGRGSHWVAPTLVAEVSFSEWTPAGIIRHGVFQGLREDKPARGVVREQAAHVGGAEAGQPSTASRVVATSSAKSAAKPAAKPAAKSATGRAAKKPAEAAGVADDLPATFKVTHGDRVMDAESGLTKIDLVRYYALVGELMMPHLKARPVSLVRAPEGVGGELFFQKHVSDPAKMPGVALADPALDPDHPAMTEIATREGLLSCAQWNVVEIHSQNATDRRYDTPDRMVFDLDPGEGVDWQHVREAAQLVRAFLEELGLAPFLKTSGGKGLHVVVPIKPALDWDTVKDFSHAIVDHLARTIPDRFAAKAGPKNRVGRVFIDTLRNGRGATTVAAWSARTRPGLGISVPVRWDELDALTSGAHWTVGTVQDRLGEGNGPWAGYDKSAKTLARAMKTLGFMPAKKKQ